LIAYFLYLIPVGAAFLGMTRKMPAVVQSRSVEASATA
jgi:hypothetical protein